MKHLITLIPCMMILLVLTMQFSQNQIVHHQLIAADKTVNDFRDVIKEEGCLTPRTEQELRRRLSKIVHCSEDEISISGDRKPKARGNWIHLMVSIPINSLVIETDFWGMEEQDTRMDYKLERYISSMYLEEEAS